ncbi:MAG TPA: anthranilate phosphoribosyltransferase [Gemmatimonadales bacterium]|jgi:anthranilate phosphoribosyltransferase
MTVSSRSTTALESAVAELDAGRPLSEAATEAAFVEIMGGGAPEPLVERLLLALRAQGESADDVAGAVRALRRAMRRVDHPRPEILVDTCGTGGGIVTTINISTAAAFVAAGAGATIAKHGNRSYTSRSGSADVIEALGIAIEVEPLDATRILTEARLVFLFAPSYHPAMRHVGPVRRRLKVPTLMNLVGPLANPAGAGRQVVGVADRARGPIMAAALVRLGVAHGLVVHADVGMDEISPVGNTTIWEVRDGGVREWTFDPADSGLETASLEGLEGGDPDDNAARILELFDRPAGAAPALRAAVILNAAAAAYVGGLASSLAEAVVGAVESLESGRARERVEALRRASPQRASER